eukprot:1924850-Rhodomonas_salina.1
MRNECVGGIEPSACTELAVCVSSPWSGRQTGRGLRTGIQREGSSLAGVICSLTHSVCKLRTGSGVLARKQTATARRSTSSAGELSKRVHEHASRGGVEVERRRAKQIRQRLHATVLCASSRAQRLRVFYARLICMSCCHAC